MVRVKCPRCGAVGSLRIKRVGNREYYFVRHYNDGKVIEHYAGPVDEYVYVSVLHSDLGLVLKGPVNLKRDIEYIDTLVKRLADIDSRIHTVRKEEDRIDILEELSEKIPVWIKKLGETKAKADILLEAFKKKESG